MRERRHLVAIGQVPDPQGAVFAARGDTGSLRRHQRDAGDRGTMPNDLPLERGATRPQGLVTGG